MTERIELRGPNLEMRLAGDDLAGYRDAVDRATSERWVDRLFERDVTLWTMDPRVGAGIADRLGWLDAPDHFADHIPALEGFGEGVRDAGFSAFYVGGMGGSSLAPDVLNRVFGSTPDWLEMRILDSTDPAAVAAVVDDLDPLATLFIVATKSGTTVEPLAFQADAWERIAGALEARDASDISPAGFMIAITDPEKSLDAIPHHDDLREVFLNPPDIGGRYSALTYVGLVPASLIGIDLDALIGSAQAMAARCRSDLPHDNPGVALGLALGSLARGGRDKLTFLADAEIAPFGAWIEQLLAESTGKHGVGIVPVDGEPVGAADRYDQDRAFVRLSLEGSGVDEATRLDGLADALESLGHPIVRISIPDPMDIAGEFYRWEVATAIAGAVLRIDPFDQPNVEEAKENTRRLLAVHSGEDDGLSPLAPAQVIASGDGITLHGDTPLRLSAADGTVSGEIRRHLARIRPTSYLALQAFIAPTPEADAAFASIRRLLRDRTRRATTLGYGPRFLHSTGQLHKGGPPSGWFVQFTADHPVDRPIPEWPYTFGQLIDAQAAGDFHTLESHDLPILRVHLGADVVAGLATFERALADALREDA
jgi:glucose-6-phosphate isomerase